MKKLVAIATVFVVFVSLGMVASAEAQVETSSRQLRVDNVPTIFDVRKSLPMEPADPTYHDFYINAGIESGFKKGQYLPIQRAIPVHDPVQNKQQAILTVPVGKVLVIHVEHGLTVARLVSELGDDERPTLEFESIMIGDRVDMKGITTEAPKDAGKKKKRGSTAAAPTEAAPSVTATIQAVVEAVAPTTAPVAVPATANTSAAQGSTSAPAPATPTASQPVKTDAASQPSSPPRVTQTVPPPTA